MIKTSRRLACLLAAALGCGCAGAVPRATPEDAQWAARTWPDAQPEQLARGREAYVARCGGCHAVIPPAHHTGDRWRAELAQMGERAHLSQADRDVILRYLVTVSRGVTIDRHAAAPH